MNRRSFLQGSMGAAIAGAEAASPSGGASSRGQPAAPPIDWLQNHPRNVTLNLKPVMTNLIHTGVWEGPCRFSVISPAEELARARKSFSAWAEGIRKGGLGLTEGEVRILDPVHLTFIEDFILKPR